ncbi:MAG: hypothetical protein IBX45_05425 [Campylobacterales bacterium]|nr:hypothetical protein [Campylobacterales bacterium]
MSQVVVRLMDQFSTYRYDKTQQKIVNLKQAQETNIDEFLAIQHVLDNHRVPYRFERNFQIQLLG